MGGKKRSRSDKHEYEYLAKKIRKLEGQLKKASRHRETSSDSEYSDSYEYEPGSQNGSQSNHSHSDMEILNEEPPIENDKPDSLEEEHVTDDILNLLGEDPSKEKTFGDALHKDIAPRWTNILHNGISKEARVELLKTYLIPENCINLRAPKLNPEIKAALLDINVKKDAYSTLKQNQLASSLSAIGQVLNFALTKNIPQDVIKMISDAGRLICDYHYKETLSRRYAIINTLNKNIRDTLKNTKADEFLFGADLGEHLKSSKAIIKSGQELRPSDFRTKSKIVTTAQLSTSNRGTLNSRGAPRATTAETRVNPNIRRQNTRNRYNNPAPRTTHHRQHGKKR